MGTAVSPVRGELLQPQVLPLPATLSSCHQAILHGQLGISLAPRSVLVSEDSPGTQYSKHTISHAKSHFLDGKMSKGAISDSKLKEATNMPDGEYLPWVG